MNIDFNMDKIQDVAKLILFAIQGKSVGTISLAIICVMQNIMRSLPVEKRTEFKKDFMELLDEML